MATYNYAWQQGRGIEPYLLKSMKLITGNGADPMQKLDNTGLLRCLCDDSQGLQNINGGGKKISLNEGGRQNIRFETVKYRQRFPSSAVSSSDTCTSVTTSPFAEAIIPINQYSQVSTYIEEALLGEYAQDLSNDAIVDGSMPPTMAVNYMNDLIVSMANALNNSVDQKLLNLFTFGKNAVTGSNASTTLNVTSDITQLKLDDGIVKLLSTILKNEMSGKTSIVGNGLWLDLFMQQFAKGTQFNGINTNALTGKFNFYYDQFTESTFGSNQAAVIETGAAQLVQYNRYMGSFGGLKGVSHFGTLPLNVAPSGEPPRYLTYDFQMRFVDCPETVDAIYDTYTGANLSGFRGWQMTLSKTFGLFQIPSDAYASSDYLTGNNGTLRFTLTNS